MGIFVAVDHLRRADLLSVEDEEIYFDIEDWFRLALPDPPFNSDGNSIGAVTWFERSTAEELLDRLRPLQQILERHGLAVAGSGGVADQLPEHAVAPAALVDAVLAAPGV